MHLCNLHRNAHESSIKDREDTQNTAECFSGSLRSPRSFPLNSAFSGTASGGRALTGVIHQRANYTIITAQCVLCSKPSVSPINNVLWGYSTGDFQRGCLHTMTTQSVLWQHSQIKESDLFLHISTVAVERAMLIHHVDKYLYIYLMNRQNRQHIRRFICFLVIPDSFLYGHGWCLLWNILCGPRPREISEDVWASSVWIVHRGYGETLHCECALINTPQWMLLFLVWHVGQCGHAFYSSSGVRWIGNSGERYGALVHSSSPDWGANDGAVHWFALWSLAQSSQTNWGQLEV